jgi:hypothetical protein
MKQWLIINSADNKVTGWQRTHADEIPGTPSGCYTLDCDDAKMAEYFSLEAEARQQGRIPVILEDGGMLSLEEDNRPYFSVTANKLEAVADNVDFITFTMTALNSNGSVMDFTGSLKFTFNMKLYKLNFVNGVATYNGKFIQSGRFTIASSNDYKVKEPLTVEAYEA